jgi:MFS family permease
MVLMGLGAGLCFPALMGLAMSGATPADAGLSSGLINTTAQVGGALGLAVLATLSSSHAGAHPTPVTLTAGYHLAFWIAAALTAVAMVIALTVLSQPKAASVGHIDGDVMLDDCLLRQHRAEAADGAQPVGLVA